MKTYRYRAFFFLLLTLQTISYGRDNALPCTTAPKLSHKFLAQFDGAMTAKAALNKPVSDAQGVWNQQTLQRHRKLRRALRSYLKGKSGQSVRKLKLKNLSAIQIHELLLSRGFQHVRIPLYVKTKRRSGYLTLEGKFVRHSSANNLTPHDIYVHPDKGMVRVKPLGVPRHPYRPQPHYSKSVIFAFSPKCDKEHLTCKSTTTYLNEAFKISSNGRPVPKGPTAKDGFRPLIKHPKSMVDRAKNYGWLQYLMSMGHHDLPASYLSCQKAA